jgi:formylglycine-generating enzyme required for sulfatase activity
MVLVKGWCFNMGDLFNRSKMTWDSPMHEVCLDDYYIDANEVTQAEYKSVMGRLPIVMIELNLKKCDNCPVSRVSWRNAKEFCRRVGKRLPTEAEWEFAARSRGEEQLYAGTDSVDELKEFAVYKVSLTESGKSGYEPVCTKKANKLGLYDMNGNVSEWVKDLYSKDYYRESPLKNPQGPARGMVFYNGKQYHVCRGGSFDMTADFMSTTARDHCSPFRDNVGFRCAK